LWNIYKWSGDGRKNNAVVPISGTAAFFIVYFERTGGKGRIKIIIINFRRKVGRT
jgi:hypothetical protein